MKKILKIAIVVHGKFHAFDLANALQTSGHAVNLFTNYPKRIVSKSGFPRDLVASFISHGILLRILGKMNKYFGDSMFEKFLHRLFGSWSARKLCGRKWDMIICWSGVAEEIIDYAIKSKYAGNPIIMLVRGSSHILEQSQILKDEIKRTQCDLEKPSDWMIQREMKEYEGSDVIRVISTFAYNSFVKNGVKKDKLALILSANPVEKFKPSESDKSRRLDRINSGDKLTIGFVGPISFRKGLYDLKQIVSHLGDGFKYIFVGDNPLWITKYLGANANLIQWSGKVRMSEIKSCLDQMDIFVFPSIEEGYAQSIAQAMANGLPILTTANTQGPDQIKNGYNGWVFPIRRAEMFVERLVDLNKNRDDLCSVVKNANKNCLLRVWPDVASEIEAECYKRRKGN